MFRWIGGLLLLTVVLLGAYISVANPWKVKPEDLYRVVPIETGEISTSVNSTGTIKPVREVQIGSFVSGPILESHVDFNTRVTKDMLMAKIDPRIYLAQQSRDQANVTLATADKQRIETQLAYAENNLKRAESLAQKKSTFIAGQELDRLVTEVGVLSAQLKVVEAQIKQATANLSQSTANVNYTDIKAPVDGIVTDCKVEQGQTVAAAFQTPVLFFVGEEMDKHMNLLAKVDEADIGQVQRAQSSGQPVNFTVDAYPEDLFNGQIKQIRLNSETNQNVVTYTVVVQAPNLDMKLLPGMTANISFRIDKRDDCLKLPNAALRFYPKPYQVRQEDRGILDGIAEELEVREAENPTEFSESQATVAIKPSATERIEMSKKAVKRIVWVIDGQLLKAVRIDTGIADSRFTEIVSGNLKAGDKVVTGMKQQIFGR